MDIGRKWLPHEVPFFVTDDAVYLITICAKDRAAKPLLKSDTASRLLETIRFYHDQHRWWVHICVIMPDHIHLLVSFAGDLQTTVRSWKRWTTRNLAIRWQQDFFEHRVRHDESLREKADYLLMNPVRGGLVSQWQEWPYLWFPTD